MLNAVGKIITYNQIRLGADKDQLLCKKKDLYKKKRLKRILYDI